MTYCPKVYTKSIKTFLKKMITFHSEWKSTSSRIFDDTFMSGVIFIISFSLLYEFSSRKVEKWIRYIIKQVQSGRKSDLI